MTETSRPPMSAYEQRAWSALREREVKRQGGVLARAADWVETGTQRAVEQVKRLPAAGAVTEFGDATIMKALEGGFRAVFLPAVRSASLEARTSKLRRAHAGLPDDVFAALDLKDLDKGRPKLTLPFLGVLEGSLASLAITGATVSATVSGGTTAAVAVGAVATDTIASLALLGRAVAQVAVHYGYDPREPEEELFLMSVLNYASAGSSTARTAALASISRLSQQMMRQATWKQLGKDPLVKVIQRLFQTLGVKLTHKRLANVVPLAGVVVAGGLSFHMLSSAMEDATRIYRARYLAEKHGLDWDDWVARGAQSDEGDPVTEANVTEINDLLDSIDHHSN